MDLPEEVVARIVSAADVPIDTFLAFVGIGAVPKRVTATPYLQAKLRAIHDRRAALWRERRGDVEGVTYQITKDTALTLTVFQGQVYQWSWERRSLGGVGRCTQSYAIDLFRQPQPKAREATTR